MLALLAAATMASPLSAQITIMRNPDGVGMRTRISADAPRAVIGITTSGSANSRDTLGVLVSAVRPGSPAEKAGIEEGDRIASVNGVSLRLAAADVGDFDAGSALTRRLTRELDKLKPGDEVDLRVYSNGQTKSVKVRTIAPADLYETGMARSGADRATLGISIGTTGSRRDSLGVFVMSVDDAGPAAKAGIEEGSRIASINGVDLRARTSNDDEGSFRLSNVGRLERELAKVKVGDEVELRVWYNNQFRNVKVKTVRAGDLPRSSRVSVFVGGDGAMPLMQRMGPVAPMPPMPPMGMMERHSLPPGMMGGEIRRTLDGMRGMIIPRIGNRVVW